MDKPIETYWNARLRDLKAALEENNFEVFLAQDRAEAKKIVLEEILPETGPKSVSWGGSVTFRSTGLYEAIKEMKGLEVVDAYDRNRSAEETYELRRRSLLVDLFITGTNAVTENGTLVNLDMFGNRVGAITFGPRNVLILVGRNKVVGESSGIVM